MLRKNHILSKIAEQISSLGIFFVHNNDSGKCRIVTYFTLMYDLELIEIISVESTIKFLKDIFLLYMEYFSFDFVESRIQSLIPDLDS